MNIDDRIEAIAQSLELLASLHRDLERNTDQALQTLTALHRELAQEHRDMAQQQRDLAQQTDARFAQTLEFINRLAHVADAHEQRLDRLEQQ